MRVLIAGCGYVGLPLGAELVKLGHEVFGLRRASGADATLKSAGILPLHADITRPEALTGLPADFDWVVNCAASGGGGTEEYRQLYRNGNLNLIEWLSRGRGRDRAPFPKADNRRRPRSAVTLRKFVYTSSTGVYGQNDGSQVDETSPTNPAVETARVLVETENALRLAARENNFPTVILRVAGIYGPDRGHRLEQFLREEARIEGNGDRFLNMIHRDDLIGVIIAALERGRAGEIYNVVDDEPVTARTFFEWLASALGKDLPPSAPEWTAAQRKRGATNKQVSNRKLKTELGARFGYASFREGYAAEIRRLIATRQLQRRRDRFHPKPQPPARPTESGEIINTN